MQIQSISICPACRKPYGPRGCNRRVRYVHGMSVPRLRYGLEYFWQEDDMRDCTPPPECRDCGCALGQRHHANCCVEECPECHLQTLVCTEG